MPNGTGINWTTFITTVSITVFGTYIVSYLEFKRTKRKRVNKEIESWYHEVLAISKRIRSESLALQGGIKIEPRSKVVLSPKQDEDLSEMNKLFSDLLDTYADAPAEIESDLLDNIESICYWYRYPNPDNRFTTSIIKTKTKTDIESVMKKVARRSSRDYDQPPY